MPDRPAPLTSDPARNAHVPDPAALARAPGDPLGQILHLLQLTGTFYCQSRLTAPWGIAIPAFGGVLTFVLVTRGRCWLTLDEAPPMALEEGTLTLMTEPAGHALRSTPAAATVGLDDLPIRRVTDLYETLDHGGGGAACELMYGILRIDHAAAGMLMAMLPRLLHVDDWTQDADAWLRTTLRMIAAEARDLRPGGASVITKLSDVVVMAAIRQWLTADDGDKDGDRAGWLRGARDPQIGRAVAAIHHDPGQDWTLVALARQAGMSRSAFAARFTGLMGQPAMRYVTTWRMHLARGRILTGREPLAAIASDLGYRSEPAFHRAFKREFGVPPGALRRADAASRS